MYVQVKNLTKTFGKLYAVRNLSFHFDMGQIYGFVGPNGAGKTTTMRIMVTLDSPDKGDIKIGPYSAVYEPEEVRGLIGFMPDYYNTYPNMKVWEYLDFFCRMYGLRGKERKNRLNEIMDFTDLIKLKDKPVDGLSKGMKQRLCLGRALVNHPKVLVLDEPAAGLDPRARIELRELLKILREQGRAILVSSHILTELAEICDGVAIIEKGELVSSGKIEDIQNHLEDQERERLRTIEVHLLEKKEECIQFLLEQPEIAHVKDIGKHIAFSLRGEDEAQIDLLRKLIYQDFPILEFQKRTDSLENLFMKLTKGEIQ
ncbi:MAG: ABC transporter ATP-binding protein [Planctomycetota bacterium]|nr:MAG: ABC transporter ATP-binding protein [Planctomycetota bacterium]